MLKTMTKRMSIWWKFKQLDRTYQPLLEKAVAFENRDALLKLEEQYWYQTACLLEERRELRKAQMMGVTSSPHRRHTGNGNSSYSPYQPQGRFGSERDITYQHQEAAWKLIALILSGLTTLGFLFWILAVNPSTRLVYLPWLP